MDLSSVHVLSDYTTVGLLCNCCYDRSEHEVG